MRPGGGRRHSVAAGGPRATPQCMPFLLTLTHITLLPCPSRIVWLHTDGAPGLSVAVPSIALHAVSTDGAGPPCVIALLDDGGAEHECDGNDDDDASTTPPAPELRFIPTPPTTPDAIFAALCDCAALNPDPDLAAQDDDGAGDWLTDGGALAAAAAGHDPLASLPADALDALVASQAARFEDAD